MKSFLITLTLSATILPTIVHGFTAGAPPLKSVCRDMVPQHHEYKPQISSSPYFIATSSDTVDGGNAITVYINKTDDTKIRGFYLQARDTETNMPIGSFLMNENVGAHSCFGKRYNAATHNNGHLLKDYVEVEWTAPTDYEGEVLILGTVLKDFVTFWSGIYAESVTVNKKASNRFGFLRRPSSGLRPRPSSSSSSSYNITSTGSRDQLQTGVGHLFRQVLNIFGDLVRGARRGVAGNVNTIAQ